MAMTPEQLQGLRDMGRQYAEQGRVADARRIARIIAREEANAAPAASPGASEPMGTAADPLAQGLFFNLSDEIAGAVGAIPGALATGQSIPEAYRGIRDEARSRARGYREENPATSMALEIGGGLLGGGASAARSLGGAAARRLTADSSRQLAREATEIGAKQGAVAGYGASEEESVPGLLMDTATGAAGGAVAGRAAEELGIGIGKAKEAGDALWKSTPYGRAVDVLRRNGIKMSSGQQSGTNWLKQTETTAADLPFIGGPQQALMEEQRSEVQKRLWRMIGLDSDEIVDEGLLTDDNLSRAYRKLSGEYERALGGKPFRLDDDELLEDLGRIQQEVRSSGDPTSRETIENIIDEFLDTASEDAARTGRWYQQRRSQLARLSRGNTPQAALYGRLKNAYDDAFQRQVGNVKGDLDTRFAQFRQLDETYTQNVGGGAGTEGFIPLHTLSKRARRSPGSKEWREFIDSADIVLSDRLGNSGTPARSRQADIILSSLAGGGAISGLLQAPVATAGAIGAATLGPRAFSEATARGVPVSLRELLPTGQATRALGPGASVPAAGLLVDEER